MRGFPLRPAFRPLVFCFLVVAASAPSWSQSQAPNASRSPTLVTVDFRVLARDGMPVRDLRPEEVSLKVKGRPRDIVAMQLVEVPTGAAARPRAPLSEAPEPFLTNVATGTGGRDVLLVIDDDGIQPTRATRVSELLAGLIDALSPADRLGMMVTGNEGARVQLTTRHDAVRTAVAGLKGHAMANEEEADTLCRTRRNLYALMSVFQNIVPSSPSVVVFVSNGFSPPTAVESISRRGQGPAGPCEILPNDLSDLEKAAAASRAHVFGLEVLDDTTSGAARTGDLSGGFEHVAGLSGNSVIRLVGNEAPALKRIASETASYYVAAFEPAPEELDGSSQRVEVDVGRPATVVRAWPTVTMPKLTTRDGKASSVKLRDVLSVPRAYREVGIRASVHVWRASSDGRPLVRCVFDSLDPDIPLAEAGIAIFDDKGAAKAQWTAQKDDLKNMPVVAALNAPAPGTYRLRLAVKDTWGAVGTLDHDVRIEAPPKGVVTLGVLVLGGAGKTGFSPLLQFKAEPAAFGAVEIYGAPKTANVTAVFELAASEKGPALGKLPGRVETMRDGLRVASMQFPIEQMPPGDVVVRAVITVDGKTLDKTPTGTLRKVAK